MKHRHTLAAALALSAYAAVVWLADPFLLIIFGVAPLLWIGLPASLLAGILLLLAVRSGGSRRPALTILAAVGAFGGLVGLAIPANHLAQQHAVAVAKAYPARVAPLLEAYRRSHGHYPSNLGQLPAKPTVPRLLRSAYGYRSNGNSYAFSFPRPGGLIDQWDYDSETRTWHLST